MSSTETAMLVDKDWTKSVVCEAAGRDGVRVLFYEDGTVRIEHKCKVVEGKTDGSLTQIICAPKLRLGNGHTVVTEEPLTIVASIACPDCGLHGHVTNGRWVPC